MKKNSNISPCAVKDLKGAEYNPRRLSQERKEMLIKAMEEFGDISGIVFNIRTGNLIAGHQRVKQLKPEYKIFKSSLTKPDKLGTVAMGYIDTPMGRWEYREVDWDIHKEKSANLAANKQGGEWDTVKLGDILKELESVNMDLKLVGFTEGEYLNILANLEVPDIVIPDGDTLINSGIEYGDNKNYTLIVYCNDFKEQFEIQELLRKKGVKVEVK